MFSGILLQNERLFITVQQIASFEFDGIVVIPKKWVKSVRNGKYERCLNAILREVVYVKGLSVGEPFKGLNSIREIVTRLRKENIWPAIEVLYKQEASLYVGPITDISTRTFRVNCYDATGAWEREYELDYKDIFKIEIDTKYVRHFNSFMKLQLRRGTNAPDL